MQPRFALRWADSSQSQTAKRLIPGRFQRVRDRVKIPRVRQLKSLFDQVVDLRNSRGSEPYYSITPRMISSAMLK
jgi:hypothetical protein